MSKKVYTYQEACNYCTSKGKIMSETFEKGMVGWLLKEDLKTKKDFVKCQSIARDSRNWIEV